MVKHYGQKFTSISEAVRSDGLKIVVLLRLTPLVPFGMNNYLCGCTDLSLWQFVLGTWLGVLPGNSVYCQFGHIAGGAQQKVLFGVGIVCGLAAIHYVNKAAIKALREAGIGDDATSSAPAKSE